MKESLIFVPLRYNAYSLFFSLENPYPIIIAVCPPLTYFGIILCIKNEFFFSHSFIFNLSDNVFSFSFLTIEFLFSFSQNLFLILVETTLLIFFKRFALPYFRK